MKKNEHLTPELIRSTIGNASLTDEEADEIISSIYLYADIMLNAFVYSHSDLQDPICCEAA